MAPKNSSPIKNMVAVGLQDDGKLKEAMKVRDFGYGGVLYTHMDW